MTEIEFNAALQELTVQRNSFGDRSVILAAQLAAALAKVAELEKEKAGTPENVVEMPRPAS